MRSFILWLAVVIFLIIGCQKKNTQPANTGPYFADVKAIIASNCLGCHSATGSWQGRPVSFDTDSSIAAQYALIKAAVADPVTPSNKRMPQVGSLSDAAINTIVSWYNKGGKISD
jgi:uncharacterized membrane protein